MENPFMEHAVAPTRTLSVVVDKVNKNGFKAGETWFNYGRTFQGERLTSEAVGLEVKMTLVASRDGKEYVRSIDEIHAQAEPPEADEDGASSEAQPDVATPEALSYAEDLARKRGISSEELETLSRIAFKKAFSALARVEASKLIEFFGGYKRSGSR
jgi:hypothetical protein